MTAVDQRPANLELDFVAGDDFGIAVTVLENGIAYVSTGAVVVTAITSTAGVVQSTNFTTGWASNVLTIALTDTQTAALTPGTYRYSVEVTKSSVTRTWISGLLQVLDQATSKGGTSTSTATLAISTSPTVDVAITVGTAGPPGATGTAGAGVAAGGASGQVLAKNSATDYDTHWITAAGTGDLLAANNLSELTATASTARTNLGLGSAATQASTAFDSAGAAAAAQAASQPLDSDLTAVAAMSTTGLVTRTASGTMAARTITGTANRVTVTNGDGVAGNPTLDVGTNVYVSGGTDVAVADGGTGSSTAAGAATNLGLGTGDSPQFTAVNVGHASDTTITRVSAGVIAVEGATIAKVSDLAAYLPLLAAGAAVENLGAVESNVNTVAATGSTETLDTSVYGVHDCTMDQACTFTFSNPAPSGKLSSFVLILRGAFTPTFPAAVDWGDATPPTYTTPSVYVFTTVDAGTTWLGVSCGKAFG